VHNFILIILIFVFLFVLIYLILTIRWFEAKNILIRYKIHRYLRTRRKRSWMVAFKKGSHMGRINKRLKFIHNIKLEILWTIIPIIFILTIIFPSLSLIADEIDERESIYSVGVLGNQWFWNYELNIFEKVIKITSNLYSNSIKNLNRLLTTTKTLPICLGMKTSFYITSNDVAHSWAIPGLGIKIDAIPGRINLKTIIAHRLGLYSGMCSELCGVEHGFMPIAVQVVTFTDFWGIVDDLLENVKVVKVYRIHDILLHLIKKEK